MSFGLSCNDHTSQYWTTTQLCDDNNHWNTRIQIWWPYNLVDSQRQIDINIDFSITHLTHRAR